MALPLPRPTPATDLYDSIINGANNFNNIRQQQLINSLREIQNKYSPLEKEQSLKSGNLINKLRELEFLYKPSQIKAQNELTKERANLLKSQAETPWRSLSGPAQQEAYLNYLSQKENGIPSNNNIINDIENESEKKNILSPKGRAEQFKEMLENQQNQKNARAKYYEAMTHSLNWRNVPPDQKSAMLAQAAGLGYDANEATKLFKENKTINDLAKEHGFDINNMPEPIYPTTTAARTRLQNAKAGIAELKVLDDKINSALKPYSRKFAGYSFKQILNAIKNLDPEEQGRFLAARALAPELQGIRLRIMNAPAGIEALREMMHKSIQDIKILDPTVSEKAFEEMGKNINEWLTEAFDAAQRSIGQPYRKSEGTPLAKLAEEEKKEKGKKSDIKWRFNPKTGKLEEI